jgi:hypothetical protein
MKDKFGILGVLIGVIGFSFYYSYAYFNYNPKLNPPLNPYINAIGFIAILLCISFLLIQLLIDSKTNAKFLVYGVNAVVWSSVSFAYIYKDLLHMIESKLLIIPFSILCSIFGFALYIYKIRRK